MKYKVADSYFTNTDTHLFEITGCHMDEKPSRSAIGKKAYKTFLKNGGKRDEKGRFCKNIDWEKIGNQLWEVYVQNAGSVDDIDNVKAFAKVFKKHNLIKEGVEI